MSSLSVQGSPAFSPGSARAYDALADSSRRRSTLGRDFAATGREISNKLQLNASPQLNKPLSLMETDLPAPLQCQVLKSASTPSWQLRQQPIETLTYTQKRGLAYYQHTLAESPLAGWHIEV